MGPPRGIYVCNRRSVLCLAVKARLDLKILNYAIFKLCMMSDFYAHSGLAKRCLKEQEPTVARSFELHVSTGQAFTLWQDCSRHRLAVPWTPNCRRYHSSQSGIQKRTIRALGLK